MTGEVTFESACLARLMGRVTETADEREELTEDWRDEREELAEDLFFKKCGIRKWQKVTRRFDALLTDEARSQ